MSCPGCKGRLRPLRGNSCFTRYTVLIPRRKPVARSPAGSVGVRGSIPLISIGFSVQYAEGLAGNRKPFVGLWEGARKPHRRLATNMAVCAAMLLLFVTGSADGLPMQVPPPSHGRANRERHDGSGQKHGLSSTRIPAALAISEDSMVWIDRWGAANRPPGGVALRDAHLPPPPRRMSPPATRHPTAGAWTHRCAGRNRCYFRGEECSR